MKSLSKIFYSLGLIVSVVVILVTAAFIVPKFVGIMPTADSYGSGGIYRHP